jgi:hypothetical protein
MGSSADQLARALSSNRGQLDSVKDQEERLRRAEAIERFGQYVDLLREATAEQLARYSFKLEFADGRWTLEEKELPALPQIGELVELADGRRWQVRGSQLVPARPSGKPPREFFVCAPAA